MADFIKCTCGHCGAKYRLPAEFQGRKARCKKCGEKFEVPRIKSLEDSVLDWLNEADEDVESGSEESVAPPRIVNIPKSAAESQDGEAQARRKGPIRMKSTPATAGE